MTEERLRFVARLLDGEGMREVYRCFGISRKTGHKIYSRYKEQGLEAPCDLTRRWATRPQRRLFAKHLTPQPAGRTTGHMDVHTLIVVSVFSTVYAGMVLGRWPALAIDRTGIALCGAIILLLTDGTNGVLAKGVDVETLAILFALMVLSAQFAAAGFYGWCAARLAGSQISPAVLLALIVSVTGALSSILVNDVVVFAMTPILCRGLIRSGRPPLPYLLGLAGAANAGSAATLVGNPQNILIGEHANLDFWAFSATAAPPAVLSLIIVYLTVFVCWHHTLHKKTDARPTARIGDEPAPLNRPALIKGIAATTILLALFATDLPRWQGTLLVAGMLLISRRLTTREILAYVDWHLLILFGGLFVVTAAFSATGIDDRLMATLGGSDLSFADPIFVGVAALLGSNTIGNVPFVMLVLAAVPELSPQTLYALALMSTLAGNLVIVGSFATLIVVERSRLEGVHISFVDHLRSGVPMTLLTMLATAGWLAIQPI